MTDLSNEELDALEKLTAVTCTDWDYQGVCCQLEVALPRLIAQARKVAPLQKEIVALEVEIEDKDEKVAALEAERTYWQAECDKMTNAYKGVNYLLAAQAALLEECREGLEKIVENGTRQHDSARAYRNVEIARALLAKLPKPEDAGD